jgi:hypothetical protein
MSNGTQIFTTNGITKNFQCQAWIFREEREKKEKETAPIIIHP